MPTKRERIITALFSRPVAIQPAKGYATETCLRVKKGPAAWSDNDPRPRPPKEHHGHRWE